MERDLLAPPEREAETLRMAGGWRRRGREAEEDRRAVDGEKRRARDGSRRAPIGKERREA